MISLGVLISGGGSNLQAIIDAIASGNLDARIALVVSSRPDAYGLERARAAGIPTLALNKTDYADPLAADEHIVAALQAAAHISAVAAGAQAATQATAQASAQAATQAATQVTATEAATQAAAHATVKGAAEDRAPTAAGVDYVVMAGYMRMVRAPLLNAYPNRIVNLHPALLPSFAGAHGIADAYAYGVKLTGITVHFANQDYDKGPIIAQRAVAIAERETLEQLEARIHAAEHELYPQVLQWLAEGRVRVTAEGKVVLLETL